MPCRGREAVVTRYPLLIHKTLADMLADKVQVIITPTPESGRFIGSNLVGVQDQSSLRTEPRASATQATALSQGDVVEIRGERADYLKVYEYRRERGGYLRRDAVRPVGFTEADAPELLGVMRFLRDTPGSESLGISYGEPRISKPFRRKRSPPTRSTPSDAWRSGLPMRLPGPKR